MSNLYFVVVNEDKGSLRNNYLTTIGEVEVKIVLLTRPPRCTHCHFRNTKIPWIYSGQFVLRESIITELHTGMEIIW